MQLQAQAAVRCCLLEPRKEQPRCPSRPCEGHSTRARQAPETSHQVTPDPDWGCQLPDAGDPGPLMQVAVSWRASSLGTRAAQSDLLLSCVLGFNRTDSGLTSCLSSQVLSLRVTNAVSPSVVLSVVVPEIEPRAFALSYLLALYFEAGSG